MPSSESKGVDAGPVAKLKIKGSTENSPMNSPISSPLNSPLNTPGPPGSSPKLPAGKGWSVIRKSILSQPSSPMGSPKFGTPRGSFIAMKNLEDMSKFAAQNAAKQQVKDEADRKQALENINEAILKLKSLEGYRMVTDVKRAIKATNIGISRTEELKGQIPELLYDQSQEDKKKAQKVEDERYRVRNISTGRGLNTENTEKLKTGKKGKHKDKDKGGKGTSTSSRSPSPPREKAKAKAGPETPLKGRLEGLDEDVTIVESLACTSTKDTKEAGEENEGAVEIGDKEGEDEIYELDGGEEYESLSDEDSDEDDDEEDEEQEAQKEELVTSEDTHEVEAATVGVLGGGPIGFSNTVVAAMLSQGTGQAEILAKKVCEYVNE